MHHRHLPRPKLEAMASQSSQMGSVCIGDADPHPAASYIVSDSGGTLTLGHAYLVSSTGVQEQPPQQSRFGPDPAKHFSLALGSADAAIKCTHISELDIDNGSQIGRGSSGKVYNVLHIPTGVRVCVKQMLIDDSRQREEVKRELDSLHKAKSPFIVDFYGAFFHNDLGVILLVLELMEGSLLDLIKWKGQLSEDEASAICYQVVCGLYHLHERHLIHRDIKPANLLFHRSGQVKITDFGVSSGQTSQDPHSVHTFVGSILYMSPERLEGLSYSYECDIWSLGICMCEAVTGHHPYQEDCRPNAQPLTFWDLLQKVLQQDPARHSTPLKRSLQLQREQAQKDGVAISCPEISGEMDSFVACCLKYERSERATAAQLLDHPWLRGKKEKSEQCVRELCASYISSRQPRRECGNEVEPASEICLTNSASLFCFQQGQRTPNATTPEESRQKSNALLNELLSSVHK